MQARYAIASRPLILDNPERRYALKIRDLPEEDRPREKLVASGPSSLSLAELLAIVLSSGTKKEEVLAMTSRIVREYGEKSLMAETDAARLAKELDIPLGKALQIVAVGELGRRLFARNENGAAVLRTAREVFDYVADMRSLGKEHLRGLYLNNHYKVIHDEVISIGTLDANIVHPREVFRPALEYAASAVILVHNHPSGECTPSAPDIAITGQLIKAGELIGIEMIDHIIVTKERFASIPASYR